MPELTPQQTEWIEGAESLIALMRQHPERISPIGGSIVVVDPGVTLAGWAETVAFLAEHGPVTVESQPAPHTATARVQLGPALFSHTIVAYTRCPKAVGTETITRPAPVPVDELLRLARSQIGCPGVSPIKEEDHG